MRYAKGIFGILLLLVILSIASCVPMIQKEAIQEIRNEGLPIAITSIRPGSPNSAGGVNVYIDFVNTSQKTIKYVTFEAIPYNRVGDVASSEIGRKRTVYLRSTGPYEPGEYVNNGHWKNAWYNHTISCIEIEGVEVEFVGGYQPSYNKEGVQMMLTDNVSNSCSP